MARGPRAHHIWGPRATHTWGPRAPFKKIRAAAGDRTELLERGGPNLFPVAVKKKTYKSGAPGPHGGSGRGFAPPGKH